MATVIEEKPQPSQQIKPGIDAGELRFQRVKVEIHEELVDSLELSLLALKQAATQWLLGRISSPGVGAARERNGRAVRFDSGGFVSFSLASQLGCR